MDLSRNVLLSRYLLRRNSLLNPSNFRKPFAYPVRTYFFSSGLFSLTSPDCFNTRSIFAAVLPTLNVSNRRYISKTPKSKNLYDVLEISQEATQADVKAAYYKLSKKYHPDLNSEAGADLRFREISEAYETLGNAQSRQNYDEKLNSYKTPSYANYQKNRYKQSDMPNFDERYNLYRNSSTKGRRTAAPPTGKTEYYDYDEFYRQHYQEQRERELRDRRWQAQWEWTQKETVSNQTYNSQQLQIVRSRIVIWMLICWFLGVIFYMLEEPSYTPAEVRRAREEQEKWQRDYLDYHFRLRNDLLAKRSGVAYGPENKEPVDPTESK